ncbi:MAG: hypothetical protein HGA51_05970 [Demequinaceae bacterium]|nr:hypothetical protein [Demequinaceae bacterium]
MISIWIGIGWLVGTALVIALAVLAIQFLAYRARVPGVGSQARSARYVVAYDDALQWLGVRYRERERLTGELRANLAAAAADSPMRDVLERMGSPKELARGVAARRRGPTWIVGAAAAMATVAAQIAATMLMQLTFLETVETVSGPGETVSIRVLMGAVFEATLGADGTAQTFSTTTSAAGLILPVLAFLLFSRPWRLLIAGRAHLSSGDSASM